MLAVMRVFGVQGRDSAAPVKVAGNKRAGVAFFVLAMAFAICGGMGVVLGILSLFWGPFGYERTAFDLSLEMLLIIGGFLTFAMSVPAMLLSLKFDPR